MATENPTQILPLLTALDFWTPAIVASIAELGVADHMEREPQPVQRLAELTGAQPHLLYRAMRALAARGIFEEKPARTFGLTPAGRFLVSGHPASLRDAVRPFPEIWRALAHGAHTLRTGQPAFEYVHQMSFFDYLRAHPDRRAAFDRRQRSRTRNLFLMALSEYDWCWVRDLIDVGGGAGHVAALLLRQNTAMRATVFDLEEGLAEAPEVLMRAGVADRARIVAGSFFENVPAGADVYLLVNILHDWDDEQCATILRACRQAMRPESRLLTMDYIVPEDTRAHPSKSFDFIMMVLFGGRERTRSEFDELFRKSGLEVTGIHSHWLGLSLIETRPMADTVQPQTGGPCGRT